MKFTKGLWMDRKGVRINNTAQVRETRIIGNKIYLYTVNYGHDAKTTGGPIIEMFISSPQPNIIRTEAWHFKGSNQKIPKFDLNIADFTPEIENTETYVLIKSGDTKLIITKRPCTFTYYYKDKKIACIANQNNAASISSISVQDEDMMDKQLDLELIGSSGKASKSSSFMRVQMALGIGEKIYGLGERFTPFVKNGQSVTTWNEDGGTNTDISYKCIPFYVTNRGYGVFVNDSGPVSYEICSEQTSRAQFSVPGEKIDFMIIGGEDMKDVIGGYTTLTGKPALPPAWSFGLWLTTSASSDYNEEKAMELIDGMADREVPLHVFLYDAFSMKENTWVSFEWDRDIFPNIEEQLRVLNEERNIKPCFRLNSYIAQRSPLFDEAKELGYMIKKPNGDVWQWDEWQSGMGIVDFTNPDAYKWFQDKLRPLLDQGIVCFKTDFGERIPTDIVYHDGSDPLRMHNYYTYLYNKCLFELLEEYEGKNKACLFGRSCTVGSQKFPVHWGGDPEANYQDMALSLRAGLSLCLSGFSFWSHDIAGFSGTATADLYKRWAAFGLLSTHSRLHGIAHKVPWLFSEEGEENGEESVAVLKAFTELKCTLMPYIYSAAVVLHKTGIPSMRAMVLEFPNDIFCEDLETQYMLGENLLVAPIFNEEGIAKYYLPKGEWTHLLSNEIKQGGEWIEETYDYFSLPLFVRENSIIPVGNNRKDPEYDYTDGLTFNIFSLKDKAEAVIYDIDGKFALKADAVNDNGKITVTLDGKYNDLKICMRNIFRIENIIGATAEKCETGVILNVNNDQVSFDIG